MSTISIPCIKLAQPIGDFFIGVIDAHDLVAISFADVRRPDGRDIERYIGTQRDLSEGRVAEIKKYINNVDACFPTGIILAISSEHANFSTNGDAAIGKLEVTKGREIAKIIDGQHRIAGLESYRGANFQINVTVFVDMDLEDQAMVFATINLKQTKVAKSLTYDLYDYAVARSPQKSTHNIAKLLNFRDGSPLKDCIKILGKASGKESEAITQAAFVDRVMKLITRDAMADKDSLKRNRPLDRARGTDQRKLIFRNLFIDDQDAHIAKTMWDYFTAVSSRWNAAWNDRQKGAILGRTTGFAALVRLLPELIVRITDAPLDKIQTTPTKRDFLYLLDQIPLKDDQFTATSYLPGSAGEGALLEDLLTPISKAIPRW